MAVLYSTGETRCLCPRPWRARVCSEGPDSGARRRGRTWAGGQVGRRAGGQECRRAGDAAGTCARGGRGPSGSLRGSPGPGTRARSARSDGSFESSSLPGLSYKLARLLFLFRFSRTFQTSPPAGQGVCVWSGRSHPLLGSGTVSPLLKGTWGKRKTEANALPLSRTATFQQRQRGFCLPCRILPQNSDFFPTAALKHPLSAKMWRA